MPSEMCVIFREPSAMRESWHDDVDGRRHLRADGLHGNLRLGHHRQGFQAREALSRIVRVDGAHRAGVTGVHGADEIHGFSAADLPDDNAVGAHTQRASHEIAHRDESFAVLVGGASFHENDVRVVDF